MVELISMNIKIMALVCFGSCAITLMLAMFFGDRLFKLLRRNYPGYYKAIGEPIILAPVNMTRQAYAQLLKGGLFAYSMVFLGIPKDFPKNAKLRAIAQVIRWLLAVVVIGCAVLVVFGYFLFQSQM